MLETVDVGQQIMLHLRPRHVLVLLQVNKAVCKIVLSHQYYFDRSAVHTVYGRWSEISYGYPKYKYMKNLPSGYHKSMEHFIQLVRKFYMDNGVLVTSLREILDNHHKLVRIIADPIEQYNDLQEKRRSCGDILNTNEFMQPPEYAFIKPITFDILKQHSMDERPRDPLMQRVRRFSNGLEDATDLTISCKRFIARSVHACFMSKDKVLSPEVIVVRARVFKQQVVSDDIIPFSWRQKLFDEVTNMFSWGQDDTVYALSMNEQFGRAEEVRRLIEINSDILLRQRRSFNILEEHFV